MLKYFLSFIFVSCFLVKLCEGIWCYQCTSSTPGCGEIFNWRGIGYFGDPCPEDNDICVKLIEKRDGQQFISRGCLSSFNFRTDIPADHYEGCRPAVKDIRLAHYVNHSIKEIDVRRNYYPETTFCFCFLDHRCNSGENTKNNIILLLITTISSALILKVIF